MWRFIAISLFSAALLHAQQINPNTQIRWPAATGSGAPVTACSSANYGQPYTDKDAGKQYYCTASGWAQPIGQTGPAGPTGPPITFFGAWSSGMTYAAGDAVSYAVAGVTSSYISLIAGNVGNEPDTSPSDWGLLAQGTAGTSNALSIQGNPVSTGNLLYGQHYVEQSGSLSGQYGNLFSTMGIYFFGDSRTGGINTGNISAGAPTTGCGPGPINQVNSTNPNQLPYSTGCGWPQLVANHLGRNASVWNYGTGGDQAADTVWRMWPNVTQSYREQFPTVIDIGTNDANNCGNTTGCLNNYQYAYQSSILWRAIPDEFKVKGSNSTQCLTTSGTWSPDSTIVSGLGEATQTGGVLTCTTLAPSNYVAISWYAADGDTATASYNCDSGAFTGTLNAFGFNGQTIQTGGGLPHNSTAFTQVVGPFSGNTAHTCAFTATATAGNPWSLQWIGSMPNSTPSNYGNETANSPLVVMTGVSYQQADAKSTTTAAYDSLVSSMVTTLASEGAHVKFANKRPLELPALANSFTAYTSPNGFTYGCNACGGLHGNALQYQLDADAVLDALGAAGKGPGTPPLDFENNFSMNSQTLTTSTTLNYSSPMVEHVDTTSGHAVVSLPYCYNSPMPIMFLIDKVDSSANTVGIQTITGSDYLNGVSGGAMGNWLTKQNMASLVTCDPTISGNQWRAKPYSTNMLLGPGMAFSYPSGATDFGGAKQINLDQANQYTNGAASGAITLTSGFSIYYIGLSGNVTATTLAAPNTAGDRVTLVIHQGSGGPWTFAFPSNFTGQTAICAVTACTTVVDASYDSTQGWRVVSEVSSALPLPDLSNLTAARSQKYSDASGNIAVLEGSLVAGHVIVGNADGKGISDVGYAPNLPILTSSTASIGGSALLVNQCASGTAVVTGVTTSMVVLVTPVTDPNATGTQNYDWYGVRSAANTVTVYVCALVAGTPAATSYNVRVIQ